MNESRITNLPLLKNKSSFHCFLSSSRKNQQGMGFYLVISIISISLLLGGVYIFSLTNENKMLTKTMLKEICLNLCESGANEAYYYSRKQMNRESMVFFKMFRTKLESTGQGGGAVQIPVPLSEELASNYPGAKVKTWILFANRSLYLKNLYAKDINPMFLDKKETMGTLRIISYASFRGVKKLLTIDRDVKVVNLSPPKYDFTLWVKQADKSSFNLWESKSGAQYRNMVILNGDNPDDSNKPLANRENGYIFLGNGQRLPLEPTSGEYYDIPSFMDPNCNNPAAKNPIIINLTAFDVLGDPVIDRFYSIFGGGAFKFVHRVRKSCPQRDLYTNLSETDLTGFKVINGHEVFFESQGHDKTYEEDSPVKFVGGGSVETSAAGLKYFISPLYNENLKNNINSPIKFLDLTKSGLDLNGTDFWRGNTDSAPQFAKLILGNVYKSFVKLKLVNLCDPNVTPEEGQPAKKWAYCPWIIPSPSGTPVTPNLGILADPIDSTKPANVPVGFLENSAKPLPNDAPVPDAIKQNYNINYQTRVVKKVYDIRAEQNNHTPFSLYSNTEYDYQEDVTNWASSAYLPQELSWDKISSTFGSYDDFISKSGLKKAVNDPNAPPVLRLDGVWMITDFNDFRFPSHLVYYGKGTLIFVNTNVIIDGLYNLATFKENFKDIYSGKKFDIVADPESKLTIVLMTFRPPGMPINKKIYITNKLVMSSLVAPDSMIAMNQGVLSDSADSYGEKDWDIDVYGNIVVEKFDISEFMDKSKQSNQETKAGGILRYDPNMKPLMNSGTVDDKNYHVTAAQKVSFWDFCDITNNPNAAMLGVEEE